MARPGSAAWYRARGMEPPQAAPGRPALFVRGQVQPAGVNRRMYVQETGAPARQTPPATHPMWRSGVPEGNAPAASMEGGETPRLVFSSRDEAWDYVHENSPRGHNLSNSGAWVIYQDDAGNWYLHIADDTQIGSRAVA